MAQKVSVLLVDDLDGGDADETVNFAIDGSTYEIDLSADNAEGLRSALEKFVEAARRVSGRRALAPTAGPRGGRSGQRRTGGSDLSPTERAHVRAWAANNGQHVAERGRIAAAVIAGWREAGSPTS